MAEENITMDLTEVVESNEEVTEEPSEEESAEEPLVSTEEEPLVSTEEEPLVSTEEEPLVSTEEVVEETTEEEPLVSTEEVIEETTEEPLVSTEESVEETNNNKKIFKVGDRVKCLNPLRGERRTVLISEIHNEGLEYTVSWGDHNNTHRRIQVENLIAWE